MNTYHFYTGVTTDCLYQVRLIGTGLKKYKKADCKYVYHIMIDDENALQYKNILRGLISDDFQIDLISSDLINDKLSKENQKKKMKMTYSKIFACSLFPQVEKVLWLDADLLVIKSGIEQLFDQDLSNFYVAATLDIPTQFCWPHQVKNAKVNLFFNAGVMLLNLKKLREDGVDKLIEHDALQWPSQIECINEDQAIFNYRFKQQVLWISPIYNNILYSNPASNMKGFQHIYKQLGFDDPRDAIKQTIIVHWPGSAKPYYKNLNLNFSMFPYWKESKEIYYNNVEKLKGEYN